MMRRGQARRIGKGDGIRVRPWETVTKSLRDSAGIDHEVAFRSSLGDGRYSYRLRCSRYVVDRRRWQERPVTCLECLAAHEEA